MDLKESLRKIKDKLKWADPFTYVDLYVMPIVNPNKNSTIEWIVYLISAFVFASLLFGIFGFILNTPNPMVIVVSGSMEPVFYRGDVIVLQGRDFDQINGKQVTLSSSIEGKSLTEFAEIDYKKNEIIFNNGEKISLNKDGDIIVYYSDLEPIQIIHRVVAKIKTPNKNYFLTKGDNKLTNLTVDQDCGETLYANSNENLKNIRKSGYLVGNKVCYCKSAPVSESVFNNSCYVCTQKPCASLKPVPFENIDGVSIFKIPLIGYIKLFFFDDLPFFLSNFFFLR